MGDVYARARRVVIWLGEATAESDLAITLMRDVVRASQQKRFRGYAVKRKMKKLKRM